jgi:hypothetical protein
METKILERNDIFVNKLRRFTRKDSNNRTKNVQGGSPPGRS